MRYPRKVLGSTLSSSSGEYVDYNLPTKFLWTISRQPNDIKTTKSSSKNKRKSVENVQNGVKGEKIPKRYFLICVAWNRLMVHNHVARTLLPFFCPLRTGDWKKTRRIPLSGTRNCLPSRVKSWTNQPKVSQAPSQPWHEPCRWLRLSTAHPSHLLNARTCLDPQPHLGPSLARTLSSTTVGSPIPMFSPLPKFHPALTMQRVKDSLELVAPRKSLTSWSIAHPLWPICITTLSTSDVLTRSIS